MRVISFYSYKGGTGRTLLLANMAVLAARLGQRVVAVDLDVEAPGLAYKLLGRVPEGMGVTGWMRDVGRSSVDLSLHKRLIDVPIERPFAAGGELRLFAAGPPPDLGYLQLLRDLQEQGAFDEGPAVELLLRLRDSIEQELRPDLLLIDARTGITTTNAVTNRVLADDVVALTLNTAEQLEGTRAVLQSLTPLTRPGREEPLGLHVVLSRILDRRADVGPYEWTEEARAQAQAVAEFLRVPAVPLTATVDIAQVHVLHEEARLRSGTGDALLMTRSDALDATALHVDYLRVARALLGSLVDTAAENALMAEDQPMSRERIARFFARVDDIVESRGARTIDDPVPLSDEGAGLIERVETLRKQAERDRTLLPDLASLLSDLAQRRAELGERAAALTATEETVEIYRELAAALPGRYRPDLARSLNNLGIRLSELGRPADALPATQGAVDIYRDLAATNPDRYRPDLANSLNNLGVQLSALGRSADALPVSQEAVDIRRELAAANPDRYRPDLASSLNNLGIRLSALGRPADALPVTQQAADIYRELAAADPDRYRPELARALNNLGVRLSALGRPADALPVTQEAVDIYRELAAANPDRYRPDLAASLNNFCVQLFEVGRPADALPISQEAVDIYRQLAAAIPDRYRPNLARSLHLLADILTSLSAAAEAEQARSEAGALLRELL